jgi:hypothetical protein
MWSMVDIDPESVVKALRQMSKMPLSEMGQYGLGWMKREFS